MKQSQRAAIYTRISDAREDDTAGVDRQREDCLALCAERGLDVVDVYEDNNVSATKHHIGKRPSGARLLEAVANHEVDVVVVWSADRLYRRPADLETLVDALGHVPVVTVKSGSVDLSTADGRMVARMLGSVAAHEVEKRGERVARAAAQRAKDGRYGGGRRRLGYNETATELVPVEAAAIRDGYLAVAKGASLMSVAQDWRTRIGVGARGGEITITQVRTVLLRPMNAGLSVYRKQIIGKSNAPAIIDEDTWRIVRATLTDPARRTSPGRPALALLSPILRCGRCGGSVGAKTRIRKGTRTPIYRCRNGHVSRARPQLDEAVTDLILTYLERNADQLTKPTKARKGDTATAEAEVMRSRLDDLAQVFASGGLEAADYAAATREARSRLAAIEARVAQTIGLPKSAALVASADVRAEWTKMGRTEAGQDMQRGIVRELVERITLHPARTGLFTMEGVDVDWRHVTDTEGAA